RLTGKGLLCAVLRQLLVEPGHKLITRHCIQLDPLADATARTVVGTLVEELDLLGRRAVLFEVSARIGLAIINWLAFELQSLDVVEAQTKIDYFRRHAVYVSPSVTGERSQDAQTRDIEVVQHEDFGAECAHRF